MRTGKFGENGGGGGKFHPSITQKWLNSFYCNLAIKIQLWPDIQAGQFRPRRIWFEKVIGHWNSYCNRSRNSTLTVVITLRRPIVIPCVGSSWSSTLSSHFHLYPRDGIWVLNTLFYSCAGFHTERILSLFWNASRLSILSLFLDWIIVRFQLQDVGLGGQHSSLLWPVSLGH